jgi:hypothetical protein
MLVALSTKLGAPLAKDVEGLKRNLSSLVGGSSGYSGSSSASASSWRSTPAAAAPAGGDRWSKYSAGREDWPLLPDCLLILLLRCFGTLQNSVPCVLACRPAA